MMAPQALTADALAYYEDRINSYRATTFTVPLETPMTHGDEVRSSLEYTATVNAEDHLKVGDVEYKNVFVVNLALSFVARQCEGAPFRATTCPFLQTLSFAKTRMVVLDQAGKVLRIDGDGPSTLVTRIHFDPAVSQHHVWLAEALALFDHEQAATWAASLPAGEHKQRQSAILKVAEIKQKRTAAAAAASAWVRQGRTFPAHEHNRSGYGSFMHPGGNLQMTVSVCDDCKEARVAADWAKMAPQEAAEWANSLKDEVTRLTALVTVAKLWVWKDPAKLGAWCRDHVKPAATADLILSDVIGTLNENMGVGLTELLPFVQNPIVKKRLLHGIIDRYAYRHPVRAARLALAIENPAERRPLLEHIAAGWTERGNADKATAWAVHIPDPEDRQIYLKSVEHVVRIYGMNKFIDQIENR